MTTQKMNNIVKQLEKIKREKKLGLMTHVVVGYPDLKTTKELVKLMEETGVDFVELQIPFSDPLADGPTIMRASEKALENGTKVKDAFELAKKLSEQVKIPLLFMAYYNIVFKYGVSKFCQDAKGAGISGLIVPDMPIEEEESEHFIRSCDENELLHIHVISPASTKERLKKNAEVSKGFIYFTARQGTTDAKKSLDPQIAEHLKDLRRYFNIPIAVGFGISSKDRVDLIRPYADVAIVGSAIIDIINESKGDSLKEVESFIKSLR
jgi:tryptophan synthase alpha chain